ncbi:MAG: HD domain-containing protein [Chitinophagales bacterium]
MKPDYIGAELFILEKLDNQLPKDLFYHGLHHTRDVYGASLLIAKSEKISEDEINLLKIATMFHDAGFISHYKNHEEAGCKLADRILPKFGFDKKRIAVIKGMIMATKIPQNPKNQLERIICDADLDYLGRDDFKDIAKTLFDELKVYMNVKDEKVWNNIQLNFLKNHKYHTEYCRTRREAKKQKHLKDIIKLVEGYNKDNEKRADVAHAKQKKQARKDAIQELKREDKAKAVKKAAVKKAAAKKAVKKKAAPKKK